MQLEIPDELLSQNHLTENQLKLEIALALYRENIFTIGQASTLSGLHQILFQKKLKERNINLHYDLDSFHDDIMFVNEP